MNEKRFELDVRLDMPKLLIDNATNKKYHLLLVNDIEEIVDLLNEQNRKIKKLERENEALESNVEWFAHQLEKHTLYSDDFLETLETIEGKETVEKIRERQNEIIKIFQVS